MSDSRNSDDTVLMLLELAFVGFNNSGIDKLIQLRRRWKGENPRYDGVAKRLQFAKWLYLTGKISG